MSANPFGDGVHDDVGPERERAAQIRCGERTVDQERNAGLMRDRGDGRDVEHFQSRIADGFCDHEPRLRSDGGADALEIARFDERRRDAEARQRMGKEIDAAAIERSRSDDMIAGAEQRRDGEVQRRHAARRAHRADAIFECRKPFLQHAGRRIGDARVDVAGAFQVEQSGGMIGIVEHVRCRLIDRYRTRARDRIGMLAGMQAQSLESWRLRRGHAFLVNIKACNGAPLPARTEPGQI